MAIRAIPVVAPTEILRFGDFEANLCEWTLTRNGQRVQLQRKQFQILRILLQRRGEVVSRAELVGELWPGLHVGFDHSLNTAVNSLRCALGDEKKQSRFIETRPGVGYRFVAEVTALSQNGNGRQAHEQPGYSDLSIGYHFLHRGSPDSLPRAYACFHSLLADARVEAQAAMALAETECLRAVYGVTPAMAASRKALQYLSAADTARQKSLAFMHLPAVATALGDGNYETAIAACRESLIEPQRAGLGAALWWGVLACLNGCTADAIGPLETALKLNPTSPLVRTQVALAFYLAHSFEEAVKHAWSALTLEPQCPQAQHILGVAYLQLGDVDGALTELENAVVCSNGSGASLASLFHALRMTGRDGRAAVILGRFREITRTAYVSGCWDALLHIALGEIQEATVCLRKADEEHDCVLGLVRHDPRFAQVAPV